MQKKSENILAAWLSAWQGYRGRMTSYLIQTGGSKEVTHKCTMQLTEKIYNKTFSHSMKFKRFLTIALQIKVNITI